MKRACTVAAWCLVCFVHASMAQETVPEQAPFRTGVELVTVDATVLDRGGRPLRGLGVDDFKVTVAGQPRRVVSADYVDWTAGPARPSQPGAVAVSTNEGARGGRAFVFLVDRNTLEPGTSRQIADAAHNLFGRLTPEDRSGAGGHAGGPEDRADVGARPRVRCAAGRGRHGPQ